MKSEYPIRFRIVYALPYSKMEVKAVGHLEEEKMTFTGHEDP